MTEPRALPVVHLLGQHANRAAERAEAAARMAQWEHDEAVRCSEFMATGRHRYVAAEMPTFMCGEEPWLGYVRHCVGTRTWATRFGQQTSECVMFRLPGDRRGSRGRKNLDRLAP